MNFNVGGVNSLPTDPHVGERRQGMATEYDLHGNQRPTIQILLGSGERSSGQGYVGEFDSRLMGGTPVRYNTRNPTQYIVEQVIPDGTVDAFDPCGRQNSTKTQTIF